MASLLIAGCQKQATAEHKLPIMVRTAAVEISSYEDLAAEGKDCWAAVIEATEHRMRPIALTAAAASLALIPIAREVFWAPMAFAIMGGIIAGTAITLLFLPALYVAWFRSRSRKRPRAPASRKNRCRKVERPEPQNTIAGQRGV